MGQRKELSQATFSARVWQSDLAGSSRTGRTDTQCAPHLDKVLVLVGLWPVRLTSEEWEL